MKKMLIPKGRRNRPGKKRKPLGILYHTTNNWAKGADAIAHGNYLRNTNEAKSWHVTIDSNVSVQHLPFDENGYHAGDGGSGHYNTYWIGVEICTNNVSSSDPLDNATYNRAVQEIAWLMQQQGFNKPSQLKPHRVVNGKNCPWAIHFSHAKFEKDVFAAMGKKVSKPKDTPQPEPTYTPLYRLGSRGAGVKLSQQRLVAAGFSVGSTGIDGILGPRTLRAVTAFQKVHGLAVDGIIGPKTEAALKKYDKYRKYPGSYVRRGDRSHWVKVVQARTGAKIDGIFGPETERKVREFQSSARIRVDGIVGPQTWKAFGL